MALKSKPRSARRLLPLVSALVLAALLAIPSSGVALAQEPFGGGIVLGEGFWMIFFNEES